MSGHAENDDSVSGHGDVDGMSSPTAGAAAKVADAMDPSPSRQHQAETGRRSEPGKEETQFEVLLLAMEMGVVYVDIEFKVVDKFMKFLSGKKTGDCKLIVSTHNYENTPSVHELLNLVAQIRATVANIVRIETAAADIVDTSTMFQVLELCHVKSQLYAYLSSLDLPNETPKTHIAL